MVNRWFSFVQYLIRCGIIKDSCWSLVDEIACCHDCITPEPLRHVGVEHHGPGHFHQMSVFTLSYTILLWSVRAAGLMAYSMLGQVGFESCACIFSSIISPEYFDLNIELISYVALEVYKCI